MSTRRPVHRMGIAVLTMAAGVLVISAAYAAGRAGSAGSAWVAAYWLGEAIVFAPLVWRLASRPALGQSEAAGLVLAAATATYLVKVCYSPAGFGFPDELEHWRTTTTLLSTHHLFGVNYLLPVSAVYPGLEEVTGAIAAITGLPVYVAGLIVAGLAHLLFTAALFVVFRLVGGSPRIAATACAIYAANPHYQVFDAIYGYQTLALAFFALTLAATFAAASVRIAQSPPSRTRLNVSIAQLTRKGARYVRIQWARLRNRHVGIKAGAMGSIAQSTRLNGGLCPDSSGSIALSTRWERSRADRIRWWALAVALAAATVVTHHVTSYLLAGSLLLIAAVGSGGWKPHPPDPTASVSWGVKTTPPRPPLRPGVARRCVTRPGGPSGTSTSGRPREARWRSPRGRRNQWVAVVGVKERLVRLVCRGAAVIRRRPGYTATSVAALALGCAGFIVFWVALVAPATGSYLAPPLHSFADGLSGILTAHPAGTGATTPSGPLADRLAGYAATGLISIGLPFGWWQIWRTQRRRTWAVALGIGSVGYYVLAVLRITTPDGAEIAGRGMTFVYIPVAYTLALALAGPGRTLIRRISNPVVVTTTASGRHGCDNHGVRLRRWRGVLRWAGRVPAWGGRARAWGGRALRWGWGGAPPVLAASGVAAVLLAGGIASGWPPYWERLPGHYVVDGFESGITAEGIAAADWTRDNLGTGNRIAADFTNYLLLGSYGDQNPVGILDTLYCDPVWTEADALLAREQNISYLLVDLRMSEQPSVTGGYFSEASPACPSPIPRQDLTKFDTTPGFDRIYDSGNIVIYALSGAQYAP